MLLLGVVPEFAICGAAQEDPAELLRRAAALSQKGDYAGAAEVYLEALASAHSSSRQAPRAVEPWTRWADFGLERFRILQLQLRGSQGGMATVLRLQAEGLYSGPETRAELLRLSADANPEQPGIWGELGVEQRKRGMGEASEATLQTARGRQSDASWTVQLEALMAAEHGDWQQAEKRLMDLGKRSPAALRRALSSWPKPLVPKDDAPGRVWDCVGKREDGCLDGIVFRGETPAKREEQLFAEERWEQLAELPAPQGSGRAWFHRGVALAELNDCARAIPALERGLEARAETAAYWLELCYASEAERAAEQVGSHGDQAGAHRLRGDILVRIKEDARSATEEYAKAINLNPKEPALRERLAQAYVSLGEMQQAKEAAKEALALDPHRAMTLRLLSTIAMSERDYSGALVFLREKLRLAPNDSWARVQVGIAYAQTGQLQEALAYLQPALAAGYPDERGALHALLAGVFRKLGREREAQDAAAESNRLSNLFQQHGQKSSDDPQ